MLLLTIIFTFIITKRSDHLSLPMLGNLAFMTQLVLTGIANQIWMIHLAIGIGTLFNVLVPVLSSRMTKLVEPNEYAAAFILTLIIETGGGYAIS